MQVCLYAFDLLFLNGESLLKAPLSRRRTLLKDSFREVIISSYTKVYSVIYDSG